MPRRKSGQTRRRAQRIIARPLEHPAEEGEPLIFGWGAHLSRREKDSLKRRAVLAGAGFVVGLIALILLYAYLNEYVFQARATVARIGSTSLDASDYAEALGTDLSHRFYLTRQVQELLPRLVSEEGADATALSSGARPVVAAAGTAIAVPAQFRLGTDDRVLHRAPGGRRAGLDVYGRRARGSNRRLPGRIRRGAVCASVSSRSFRRRCRRADGRARRS